MADLDLSGSSNLVALVYNEQPPPVDPKVLQERLKKEKQMKKDEEKTKRQREKEKEKEERRNTKMTSPHNKRVTIEHVKYSSPDDSDGVKPREVVDHTVEEEEAPEDKSDFRCGKGVIFCLVIVFLISMGVAFIVSFKLTEQSLGGRKTIIQEEDGIVRLGALFSSEPDDDVEEETEGRLPRNIEPIWYNLTSRVFLPGFVDIPANKLRLVENSLLAKFRVVSDTKEIVLNSALSKIPESAEEWKILKEEGDRLVASPVQVSTVTVNSTAETVLLALNGGFKAGMEFLLKVSYVGNLSSSKIGLYTSTYRTVDGKERELVVTQSEPQNTRRILPCMDEPDRKAVFRMTIEHPKGTRALFNGIETGTEPVATTPDFVRTHFKETPRMSSYLLAFAVSDLAMKVTTTSRGIPVRAFVQSDLIDHIDYALNVTVKMLEYYEKEFQIPYPLDKLDLISVKDFSFGAMENWGLMVFHERFILFHPQVSSPLSKKEVAKLLSHEVSHQWFGNLVTMKWWSDVWLNEAFASHCEDTATARAGVMEGLDDLFYFKTQGDAHSDDSFASSRPLSTPLHKQVEIAQLFDSTTYSKGASIVRQLEEVVGVDNFRNGIRAYLKKFSYGNAGHDDLIESIKESLRANLSYIGAELKPFMRRFTKQNGFPVVNVERPDTMHVELSQEWFQKDSNSDGLNKHGASYGHVWEIPLFYEINEEPKAVTWMTEGLRLPSNQSDLLILNSDSRGFYRVNYDPRSWSRIHEQLNKNHTHLSPLTRLRLITDSFALADAGKLPYDVALDTIRYLPSEDDRIPILGAIQALELIQKQMGGNEDQEKVKTFIRRVLTQFYKKIVNWERLTFEDEDIIEAEIVDRLINQLWQSGDKEVADKLHRLFEDSLLNQCKDANSISSQCSKVPPLIRSISYCEGAKRGRDEEFNALLRLYKNEIAVTEKSRLMNGLKCSRDTASLKRLFQSLLDEKNQGLLSGKSVDEEVFLKYGNHDLSKKIYNEFFFENHEKLMKKYSKNTAIVSYLADAITASTKSELADIESFLLSNPSMDEFDGFAKAVETCRSSLTWQRKHAKHLVEEFEKRSNRV
ncbi:hypothetical protein PFISCL1PPCAC_2112 [Pristionchus fissidentatus]|uniref:Aminopeptidase n=1 Tax=Pristionchus fissidentatus TaxID=1538716 RepID=A0AAV5UZ51_9BILA|nr:hypothetical protein PFISCL1PPCAC_2112 [Pristionchus fissidentatus]